jgi:hypothetical protein
MAKAASTQTITQGVSTITAAGAYNAPASGRGFEGWGSHRLAMWTLSAVTFAANGLIGFDPKADGKFPWALAAVWGYYQPAGASDHLYVVASFDPVNTNLQCWDLTDNDAGATDSPAGQFIIFAMSD